MAFEESLRVDKRKDAITEVGVTRDYTLIALVVFNRFERT